jgi:hypothetical protein
VRKQLVGQLLLSLVLAGTVVAVIGFQWNDTHLFNPHWHPHARFHLVQLIGLVSALSVIGLWLVWRESSQPRIGAIVATVAMVAFWGGEFYALLVPGTSPAYDLDHPNTVELPVEAVYGNLLFAGLMIAVTAAGALLLAAEGNRKPITVAAHGGSATTSPPS